MSRLRLSLGAIAATTLCLLALAQSRPARAICYCGSLQSTAIFKGKGPDCTAAQADLEAKAGAAVDCGGYNICGGPTLVITTACSWNSMESAYRIFGKMTYRCDAGDTCP